MMNDTKEALERVKKKVAEGKIQRGSVVLYDWELFGQVPQALLRDPTIHPTAKALFGLLHTYSQHKSLSKQVTTFVSQETLGKCMGLHYTRINKWLNYLKKRGWLSIKRRGLGKSNIYTLHSRPSTGKINC